MTVEPEAGSSTSKAAVAGGLGGAGVLIWLLDRVLVDGGEQAAATLHKLSPVLGPVWASWPVLALGIVVAWAATDRWKLSQARQVAAARAQADASTALTNKVSEVTAGLEGLRAGVDELRGALARHSDQTDERLREHKAEIRSVQAEVTGIRTKVAELAQPRARTRRG